MSVADMYREMMLKGLPITGLNVVDAHDHLGPYSNFAVHRGGGAESMIERADTAGIEIMCVSAHAAIGPDMRMGNGEAAAAVGAHPGRIYAYVTVKPCSEREMAAELEERFAGKGFIGVKLHPGLHGARAADASYRPAMEYADARGLPVLIHTWSHVDLADVDGLGGKYGNARFIIAHMGGAPDNLEHALEVMRRRDNVFGDTALSYAPHRNIEYAVKKAGRRRSSSGRICRFMIRCSRWRAWCARTSERARLRKSWAGISGRSVPESASDRGGEGI